jgi:hypothetical protein
VSDGSFISFQIKTDSGTDLLTEDDGLAAATKKLEPKEEQEEEEEDEEKPDSDGNGLDSQWNKRMKERLERIKSKKLRDTVSFYYIFQFLSFLLSFFLSLHHLIGPFSLS